MAMFFYQLLQQDTKPQKTTTRRKPEPKSQNVLKQSRHPQKFLHAKKPLQNSAVPSTKQHRVSKQLVAGHLVSNESKHAAVRRGVCQEDDEETFNISPKTHQDMRHDSYQDGQELVNISPRHHHQRHQNQHKKHTHTKVRQHEQSDDLLLTVPDGVDPSSHLATTSSQHTQLSSIPPGVSLLQPICQKCGWTMTSATGEVIQLPAEQVIKLMEAEGGSGSNADVSASGTNKNDLLLLPSSHGNIDADIRSEQLSVSSSKHSPRQPPQQSQNHHHSPRNRKTSQESLHSSASHPLHHHHHQGSTASSGKTASPRGRNTFNLSPAVHQRTNSATNSINATRSSLTTSVHCHSRASQTDPNLLNQDLSPFAEVDGSSNPAFRNSNVSISGSSSGGMRQKGFVKAKPPSGRLARDGVLGANAEFGSEILPVVEAVKAGNIQLLVSVCFQFIS